MQVFSQRDPRWASRPLGNSGQTIGQIGCVVTDLGMLSTYFKPDRTPGQIVDLCKFTKEGKILWDSVNFENWKFEKRVYLRDDAEIRRHIKDPNLAVILQVANATHWVVATSVSLLSGIYKIADPWLGDRADINRYNNKISGAAYFTRK